MVVLLRQTPSRERLGLIARYHTMVLANGLSRTTAANESDIAHTHHLLHGEESQVHLDAGYTGVERRDEIKQAQGQGTIRADVNWNVAAKRSKIEKMPAGRWKDLTKAVERKKAQIRARVEHPFHVVKNLFGHKKTRYKGLAKNTAQMFSLFGLANLVIAKKPLLAFQGGQSVLSTQIEPERARDGGHAARNRAQTSPFFRMVKIRRQTAADLQRGCY